MHLTSHITHSNVYTPYIAYHRSNGFHQLFRKLKPKPKLNPHNAHRSQIKICVSNVPNMPNVPNAFRILKPIQKSSKRVWVFRNTGANAFAKNQMRLAYEDKRDLYCISNLPSRLGTKTESCWFMLLQTNTCSRRLNAKCSSFVLTSSYPTLSYT